MSIITGQVTSCYITSSALNETRSRPMSRKKAILSNETIPQNPTNNGERPRRPARERLQNSVLEELWSIWQADPRVPSLKSRRSWAISRNASPRLVDGWFLRRRTCAKKAGQPISAASYNLPLDPPIAPKREQSTTPLELEAAPDLPSDDTLVYPPDNDDLNDIEASSDTVFEDVVEGPKRAQTPTYKEGLQHPRPSEPKSSKGLL
ncbi:hypothetical protein EV363DRAFT_1567601 [Boletus edulis]|nr:hypothetical protein EV363DRAFT_1567601 [Boletus edulis]